MSVEQLTVEDLHFALRWSARRKTLQITVDRGGELLISAPPGTDLRVLEGFVLEKKPWIYSKLAAKNALRQPLDGREYVIGEGFSYLGRSHRLRLVPTQDRPLKLEAGRFKLLASEVESGRRHFVDWYSTHARSWLQKKLDLWAPQVGILPTGFRVMDLGFRWGSCGVGGSLNFHWATILLPARVVEYVVVHELAHLIEANHTPGFWKEVERVMPDYLEHKAWLAAHGGRQASL